MSSPASGADFPESRMVDCNGTWLEVFEAGQGGVPVVLCHGWPELAYSWRYQVPALAAAGYHVIVPNQRGYGRSDKPGPVEAYDIHHLSGDHAALLDALGIERAIYVGHDWGAIVVWNHARLYPERVAAVANLSVPLMVRGPMEPLGFWEEMLGQDFYIVHFNRQPGVAAASFGRDPEQFLRNMYRTEQWLDVADKQPAGVAITRFAEEPLEMGRLMMSEDELKVFVDTFAQHGFFAPCNWYRNFTRNWETTADMPETVSQPALML